MDKRSAIWILTDKRRLFDVAACHELREIITVGVHRSHATTQGELAEHLGMSRQRLARICVSLEIDKEIKGLLKEARSLANAWKATRDDLTKRVVKSFPYC